MYVATITSTTTRGGKKKKKKRGKKHGFGLKTRYKRVKVLEQRVFAYNFTPFLLLLITRKSCCVACSCCCCCLMWSLGFFFVFEYSYISFDFISSCYTHNMGCHF